MRRYAYEPRRAAAYWDSVKIRFSAAYLLAVTSRTLRDVGELDEPAQKAR